MGYIRKRNNVQVSGNGAQTIMFAHGFGCDQNMWRFMTPDFLEEYQVVLFDYSGCGQSAISEYDPNKYRALEGYAEDIVDICVELNLQNTILVGHSVSGTIATLASIKAPELFSKLVHIAPSPCFLNDPPNYMGGFEQSDLEELLDLMDKNYIGWAQYLAPIVIGNEATDLLKGELSDSFCSTDPRIAKNFAKATFLSDHRESFSQSVIPSLIIQSEVDALASIDVGNFLNKITPNSDLVIIESVGHCPHMTHPIITTNATKQYLSNG